VWGPRSVRGCAIGHHQHLPWRGTQQGPERVGLSRRPWLRRRGLEMESSPPVPAGAGSSSSTSLQGRLQRRGAGSAGGGVSGHEAVDRAAHERSRVSTSRYASVQFMAADPQRSSWMRIRLPAGSRKAQSRTPYGCSTGSWTTSARPTRAHGALHGLDRRRHATGAGPSLDMDHAVSCAPGCRNGSADEAAPQARLSRLRRTDRLPAAALPQERAQPCTNAAEP
jgi:hypothetical protein